MKRRRPPAAAAEETTINNGRGSHRRISTTSSTSGGGGGHPPVDERRRVTFANGTRYPPSLSTSTSRPDVVVAGGATYRSAPSTKRALDEIGWRKAEGEERRRAIFGLVGLLALATTVRLIGMGGRGGDGGGEGVMNIINYDPVNAARTADDGHAGGEDEANDEWDSSLKRMREADSTNIDLADDNGCNVGALGAENGANGGELVEEAV